VATAALACFLGSAVLLLCLGEQQLGLRPVSGRRLSAHSCREHGPVGPFHCGTYGGGVGIGVGGVDAVPTAQLAKPLPGRPWLDRPTDSCVAACSPVWIGT
jgi:hypothetical protein